MKHSFLIISVFTSILLQSISCGKIAGGISPKPNKSHVKNWKISGVWFTDGSLNIHINQFYKNNSCGSVTNPIGDDSCVSLGMEYSIGNNRKKKIHFDMVGVEFQTNIIGKPSEFFVSSKTITLREDGRIKTYSIVPYGENKLKVPPGSLEPFEIPPSHGIGFNVTGDGTPVQLATNDTCKAERVYKILITVYSNKSIVRGPFTIFVSSKDVFENRIEEIPD